MTDAEQYDALTQACGVVRLVGRTLLEVSGDDRSAFLHNLCTNDVQSVSAGSGCEAFFTNVQGKILGFGKLFSLEDRWWIDTSPGQAEALTGHLDRYIIREDVVLSDRTAAQASLLLAGPAAATVLSSAAAGDLPESLLASTSVAIDGHSAVVHRVDMTSAGDFLLHVDSDEATAVEQALATAGAIVCGEDVYEAARIEAGTPCYGRDISLENLPQEVDRDERAISFTAGCYLGQETVARIDALGHVNRLLRGVRFKGSKIPAAGCELLSDGKVVGKVTSAVHSPQLQAPLAMAYVRRGHHEPQTRLESTCGPAEIVALPVS